MDHLSVFDSQDFLRQIMSFLDTRDAVSLTSVGKTCREGLFMLSILGCAGEGKFQYLQEVINQVKSQTSLTTVDLSGQSFQSEVEIHDLVLALRGGLETKGLKHLSSLILRGANLGESAIRSLLDWAPRAGEEPRGFPCLKKLDLSENGIRLQGEEYETIRSLPLEYLDLSENALIPESMRGFSKILPVTLKVLKLGYNGLGNDGCDFLAGALLQYVAEARDLIQLQELHVEWNEFWCVRGLMGALQHLTALKVLNLTGNRIKADGAKDLSRCMSSMERLYLRYNDLEDSGFLSLIPFCKYIRELNLLENHLSSSSMHGLLAKLPLLQSLDLSRNCIGAEGVKALFSPAGREKGKTYQLEKLGLSSNGLGPEGARFLALALLNGSCNKLNELQLDGNEIGPIGLAYIAEAAEKSKAGLPIKRLELGSNHIGPEGANELYRLLVVVSPTLERLIVKQNNLRDEGMREIVRAMNNGGLSKLRSLYLAENGIGPLGGRELADFFKINGTGQLEMLHLQCNLLGNSGARAILSALQAPPGSSLKFLNISLNDVHGDISDIKTTCEVMVGEYTMDTVIQHEANNLGAASDVPRPASGSGINFIRERIKINKLFGKWSGVLFRQSLIIVGIQSARLAAAAIIGNSNIGLLVIFIAVIALHELFISKVEPLMVRRNYL